MKKGLIFVLFALVSIVSYSQISWNAKVGMNMSNLTGDADTDMKIGFNVGVGAEYAFTEMWSVQPSLMFTSKGNIVVKAGPYFGFGIAGKYKAGGEKIDFFKDTKDEDGDILMEGAKKFDAGLGVGVAYEINKFFIDLTGEFGLTKIYDGDGAPKNINFSIGVGYKF